VITAVAAAGLSDPGPVWAGAAPPLADGFVARAESGGELRAALAPGATIVVLSTTAPDGPATGGWQEATGKSQLAAATALSLWERGDIEVVVWVSATSRAAVMSAYAEAAAALEGQSSGDAAQAAERFASWLRETARPWLVVLDDLAAGAVAEDLWPRGKAGRVLVTAGRAAAGSAGAPGIFASGAMTVYLGSFSRREALTYIMGRLKSDADQRQGAADLVSDLGDEPLALALASGVIASSELTCHDYRDLLSQRRKQVTGGISSAAAIAWAISVEHVDILSPGDAQPLLVRAALLDGNGIPVTAFGDARGKTPADAQDDVQGDLAALEQAGLLTVARDTVPPRVRMNRMVQASVRAAMPAGMLAAAAVSTADALALAWPASDQPEWLSRAFRSCTASLRKVADDLLWGSDNVHDLLLRAGRSLDDARLTSPAVDYWEDLANASARRHGPGHPGTILIRERLARANLAAGRTNESIDWFHRVRNDRARVLGAYHPETANASHDLGRALLAGGRAADAVGALNDALGGYERVKGPASIEALTAREDLAAAYRAAGRPEVAIAAYRRALADRERMQGKRHPDTLAACRRLADAYRGADQPKPAITLYKRVLDDAERTLGTVHLDTIAIRESLATAHYGAGRLVTAVMLYEQVREEYTRTLGPDHERTLNTSLNLAHSYYAAGRLTDATRLLRETVERCDMTRTSADPLARTARESLANITGER
jgi:tetratricopeptide (TPR) repeat protein